VSKVFNADSQIRQKVQALIRYHAESAASDQSLVFLFFP